MMCSVSKSAVPAGLVVEAMEAEPRRLTIMARSARSDAACPDCGQSSRQVHSQYGQQLLDLPAHGRAVTVRVRVRRFRCGAAACPRMTFTEPLGDQVAARSARRTSRLQDVVYCLGVALGGRPAVPVAGRLMLPVSRDTLLRTVRRRTAKPDMPVQVIGIDDWAWRRRQRYGTLVCDLERRRIVDLLPDREAGTIKAWLERHPGIAVIARDRCGVYAQAASAAAPGAMQVADRWHLMENASAAFLEAVRQSMRPIRQALGCAAIDPALLTAAERLQYDGHLRRKAEYEAIRAMSDADQTIREIVRRTGRSRKLVRGIVRGGGDDMFRSRVSTLTPHLTWLEAAWDGGCRNGAALWRRLRGKGFGGSLRVVTEWTTRRRRSERAEGAMMRKPPQARCIARLMLARHDQLTREESVIVAAAERAVPILVVARELVDRFHTMLRKGAAALLPQWIADAKTSVLASFGRGIASDLAAVTAALSEPWSNGQTEGQITKLKLLRRQMYGRGNIDLLRARLVGASDLVLLHGK
jgi:transposase